MGPFLKKNWPLFALFAAIGVILYLMMALDRANDEAIAQLMADRAVAKHLAASKAIIAKYAGLNAAKDQELNTWRQGNKILSAEIQAKRKELSIKAKTLAEAQASLDNCVEYVGEMNVRYTTRLDECENLWRSKVELKDAEIAEWKAKDEASIKAIGLLTAKYSALVLHNRKKLIIGPQIHYGTAGVSVGIGATWELFRFKTPGQ